MIYVYFVFLSLAAFLLTLLTTRLLILRLRRGHILIDLPNQRSNHVMPVPKGGGLAILVALSAYFLVAEMNSIVIVAMVALAGISLLDDWIGISPITRLLAQFGAVIMVLQGTQIYFFEGVLPHWLELGVFSVMWVWFINLFNFMDGIDGLAGVETISIATGILFITAMADTFGDGLSLYALILLGAASGFLWWNWYPAKIFLGDVGSIPLGFIIFYLLLLLAQQGFAVSAVILPAYFIMDATVTVLKRAYAGKRVWEAHSEHYYQKAVRAVSRHDSVVRIVFGVNMLLIALATLATIFVEIQLVCLIVAYVMVAYILWYFQAAAQPSKV